MNRLRTENKYIGLFNIFLYKIKKVGHAQLKSGGNVF